MEEESESTSSSTYSSSSSSSSSTAVATTSSSSTSSTLASYTTTSLSSSSTLSTSASTMSSSLSTSSLSTTSSGSSSSSSSSSSTSTAQSETSSSSSSQYGEDLRIEIVDGIAGAVTKDAAGNPNELRVDIRELTQTHTSEWFSFRLPPETRQPCYLRLRLATPLQAGYSLWIDELVVAAGTELYPGGPSLAVIAGRDAPLVGDNWSLVVSCDRRGGLQEWFHRLFDTAGAGVLLPISGQNPIPDSVFARTY